MSTALEKKEPLLPSVLTTTLQQLTPRFPALLPPDISTEQFRAALWLELTGRPALADCTPESLRECTIKAATYGLLPGRDCHFLPFNDKGSKSKKATYVPNYQGILLALERTGKVRRGFAHPVHEGDEWGFDLFADRPIHKPAVTLGKKPGKELFYYGAIMFHDGTCAFEVVSLEDLEALEKRAPGHEQNPWSTDRVMMRRKTAIKRVAKYVRLTSEIRGMLEDDDARLREDIPHARHAANVTDLFGDADGRTPTDPDALTHAPGGGKVPRATQGEGTHTPATTMEPPRGLPGDVRQSENWQTMRHYQDDARLHQDLRSEIRLALQPGSGATDDDAARLASMVLDCLDADAERDRHVGG